MFYSCSDFIYKQETELIELTKNAETEKCCQLKVLYMRRYIWKQVSRNPYLGKKIQESTSIYQNIQKSTSIQEKKNWGPVPNIANLQIPLELPLKSEFPRIPRYLFPYISSHIKNLCCKKPSLHLLKLFGFKIKVHIFKTYNQGI